MTNKYKKLLAAAAAVAATGVLNHTTPALADGAPTDAELKAQLAAEIKQMKEEEAQEKAAKPAKVQSPAAKEAAVKNAVAEPPSGDEKKVVVAAGPAALEQVREQAAPVETVPVQQMVAMQEAARRMIEEANAKATQAQQELEALRANATMEAPAEEKPEYDGKVMVTLPIVSARTGTVLQSNGSDIVAGTAIENQGIFETKPTVFYFRPVTEANITEAEVASVVADESNVKAFMGIFRDLTGAARDVTGSYYDVTAGQAAKKSAKAEMKTADNAVEIAAAGATKMNISNTAMGGAGGGVNMSNVGNGGGAAITGSGNSHNEVGQWNTQKTNTEVGQWNTQKTNTEVGQWNNQGVKVEASRPTHGSHGGCQNSFGCD